MANLTPALLTVLEPVIEPVRAVLRDMDVKDVPASIRKVASYTGKRLPPPLLKSLVVELDRNEWLRSKVVEEFQGELDGLAAAFLERPTGWWMEITTATATAAEAAPAEDLRPEVERLQGELAEAKRRTADARQELDQVDRAARLLRRELRNQPKKGAEATRLAKAQSAMAALQGRLEEESARRQDAEQRLRQVMRQKRPRAQQPPRGEAEARTLGMEDPVATARRLDLEAAALAASVRGEELAVFNGGDEPEQPAVSTELVLPAGIAPDSPAAIDWLVRSAPPVPVVVDGYNVTFLLEPTAFVSGEARQRLIAELERLLRHARAAHGVTVVFDSSLDEEAHPAETAGGVEIVFATSSDNADEAIVARTAALDGRCVVITNDRELRERVDVEGALALWGTALVEWMRPA